MRAHKRRSSIIEDKQTLQNNQATPPSPTVKSDGPPERLVRHVFWKYPLIAVVLLVVVAVLAATVGSPNYPRDTIAGASKDNPGGAVMAFTQELDGTASSSGNAQEFSVGDPGQGFVLWNLLFAAILLFFVPLVPGVRDIPRYLKLYRFIYRYPAPGELEKPAFRERHGATHGGVEMVRGGE